MIDNENVETLRKEWSAGILLNPFAVINQTMSEAKPKAKKSDKPKRALSICREIADLFLSCTDYLAGHEDEELKSIEWSYLTAMFLYLYTEAPPEEQSLCMICEMICADSPDAGDHHRSDLDRLFRLLEDKDEDHLALAQYERYRTSGSLKSAAYKSVRRRFRPLITLSSDHEDNLFAECSQFELFELAAAMTQNCVGFPEEPRSIYGVVDETVYATVALAYMMIGVEGEERTRDKLFGVTYDPATCTFTGEEEERTCDKLFDILCRPDKYSKKISATLRCVTFSASLDLQGIIEYWFERSEKAVAAGNINWDRLRGVPAFFREFK